MTTKKTFMKRVTLMWTFIALMSFIVSCIQIQEVTDETIVILKVVHKEDGRVNVATSITYQGEEWLEDIDLKLAEYTRYEGLPELPVQMKFIYMDGHTTKIQIILHGRNIKTIWLTKESAEIIKDRIEFLKQPITNTYLLEDPTK